MTRAFIVLATLLCAVYAINYSNSVQLNNNYGIAWNIVADKIQLKLEVNTTGWVAFGIAEQSSGSMPGADIVSIIVNDDKTVVLADRFATQKSFPQEDACSHWSLISATEANGMTTVEITRLLDTEDDQDRPFTAGLMKIIYAYGTSDSFGYHGDNRFFSSVTFIPGAPLPQSDPNWKSIDLAVSYKVPSSTTTYACTTHVLNFDTDVHLVQFEVLINSTNKAFVHHILMYRCSTNNTQWFANRNQKTETCDALPGETDGSCHEVVWGWAHGAAVYIVPDDIGFRAGPSTDAIKWLEVQIHYDNPNSISTIVDNSGVRLYYTDTLRKYDAGVVTLGDPATAGADIPPGVALTEYEYTCSPACTENLPGDVQVFGSLFHMHELGARGWTRLWRGTQDLGYTTRIEYYDYGFQEFIPLNFTLKAGDRLQTHCGYDSRTRSTPTRFGSPSNQEMCMDFVMYYPRVPNWDFCGFIDFGPRNYTICGLTPIDEANPTNIDPYGGILPVFGTENILVCPQNSSSTTGVGMTTAATTSAMDDGSSAGRVELAILVVLAALIMLFV